MKSTKHEFRSTKWFGKTHHPESIEGQIQNSNVSNSKRNQFRFLGFSFWGLFRISNFEFRIFTKRGFSLVETIIYIGLLVFIIAAVINMALLMSHSYNYLKLSRHVQISAVTSLDRMIRDIRNSQSINVAQSTLGTSPGVLTLNTTTASGTPQTVQFYVSLGGVRVKQDGGDVGPLTLPDVAPTSLLFRQITGISQAVKIELTLSTGVGPSSRSANFYATAILRDSY